MDNTQKFNGHAEYYAMGRPTYANAFIDYLYNQIGFSKNSIIADIGSGTGKFAKQLLEKGSHVYCVEPNQDMRHIAINDLSSFPNFYSVNGTDSSIPLPSSSFDFITAAQSFHWFNPLLFKKEVSRILKPSGQVFLIWNMRDMSSEINQKCYTVHKDYCPNFIGFSGGIQYHDSRIKQFFNNHYESIEFNNPLYFDQNKFINRCLSGSYSLTKFNDNYFSYINELNMLFKRYASNNLLCIPNKTVAYYGHL